MLLARIFFGDIEYNVIFNSVNLEKFAPKMSKNNDDLTFIHVGRYTYQKNQEFIIKIFYNIKKKIKKIIAFLAKSAILYSRTRRLFFIYG